jgi:hypothetical protein
MGLILVERTKLPGGRPAGRFDFNDIRTKVAENLPTQQTALGSQVENSIGTEHWFLHS